MAPKQLKLTNSLFAFQRISQGSAIKRKQTTVDDSPQQKKRVSPVDGCDGEAENANPKECVVPQLEGQCQSGAHGTDEALVYAQSTPTPSQPTHCQWDPLHVLVEPTWKKLLKNEFQMKYMRGICCFLEEQDRKLIFNAFNLTPFNSIRVVIIGQDPYHNVGQAHGLSFSVPNGEQMPPSLKNIFKELSSEYPNFVLPKHGTLIKWATQGVFLLNASLTVEAHKANSHAHIGWQQFTDAVIRLISSSSPLGIVFLLWGGFAHKKEALIDKRKHRIIKTAHPSPLSAHRFFGCKCFSKTNDALKGMGREPIEWTSL